MKPLLPTPLVTPSQLRDALGHPKLVVLDASWYLPAMGRDAEAEYLAGHVPGARRFDLDAVSDPRSSLPHMLPAPEHFESAVRALGVEQDSFVVVYDGAGLFSAPRVWWSFRVFGCERVAVLDGGLPAWTTAGEGLISGPAAPVAPGDFEAKLRPELVRSLEDVRALQDGAQLVDARPAERFRGAAPEPRPGVRGGHVPGSRNLPFTHLIEPEARRMKSASALAEAFERAGVDRHRPVVTSCGSGVTAAILTLGLHVLGHTDAALYDGSWSEWGSREDTEVEQGP